MSYEKDILIVLKEAGDAGLTVQKITRHIFNEHNTFFETTPKEIIRTSVQRYLMNHSKRSDDTVERIGHGMYRLNKNSAMTKELLLEFSDDDDDDEPKPIKDQSLSLF